MITANERSILRELARRQADIASRPEMAALRARWYDLNDGKPGYPLVTMEFHGVEREVYPPLSCESGLARALEAQMARQLFKYERFRDDRVIPPTVSVAIPNGIVPFGFVPKAARMTDADGEATMAYRYEHAVSDLRKDFGVFKPSVPHVDAGLVRAKELLAEAEEAIGDLIEVRLEFPGFSFCPSHILIQMMSMETMYLSILDEPELFHRVMRGLTDDFHAYIDALEAGGAILPNNDESRVPMDTYCYTHDLPGAADLDRPARLSDVWSYTNFQETVGMSPEMFDEFFFCYTEEIINRSGLHVYGCCEPVHTLWEPCLKRLKNLRKVSISPWCDEGFMGEAIRGRKIVYQRKPFPNFFSDVSFDEGALRDHLEKTVVAARGCPLEVTFRDICSVHGDPNRLTRGVALAREAFERAWKG